MKDTKKILTKYTVIIAIAAAIAVFIMSVKGINTVESTIDTYKILTDAFTVPGVLFMMIAALMWASKDGFFDGLGFSASRIGNAFLPLVGAVSQHENYYEYKQRKIKNRGEKGFLPILYVGLGFFAVAMIFYILYKISA